MLCLPNPGDGCSSSSQRVYVYSLLLSNSPSFPVAGLVFSIALALRFWSAAPLSVKVCCRYVLDIVLHTTDCNCFTKLVQNEWCFKNEKSFMQHTGRSVSWWRASKAARERGGEQEVKGKHIWGDQSEMASFELHHLRGITSLGVQG